MSDATYSFFGEDSGDYAARALCERGDANGDGLTDLAISSGAGAYLIDGGMTRGSYALSDVASGTIHSGESYFTLTSADYDDDGDTDIFLAGSFGRSVYEFTGPISGDVTLSDANVEWTTDAGLWLATRSQSGTWTRMARWTSSWLVHPERRAGRRLPSTRHGERDRVDRAPRPDVGSGRLGVPRRLRRRVAGRLEWRRAFRDRHRWLQRER
jgi:hypothetical protein